MAVNPGLYYNHPGLVEGRDVSEYVVFVTGALESKIFLFKTARNLGYKVAVIDAPTSGGNQLLNAGHVDTFIAVDVQTCDYEAVGVCVSAIQSACLNVVGVVTFMEMAVTLTARIADSLGLPGLSPEAAAVARDKHLTRAALSDVQPIRSVPVTTLIDVNSAAAHVRFPAVLKPISGADSIGVKRINRLSEAIVAFEQGCRAMSCVVIKSGLLCLSPESSRRPPTTFLFEEYLDGPEVDIDLVMYNGRCMYAAVSDNGDTIEPYFTETYGVLPSRLDPQNQQALEHLAISSVLALGLTTGVFHVEAKLTSHGPRLIEVNARMGGGPIREMHKRVNGVDLAAEQIRLACGKHPKCFNWTPTSTEFAYMTTNALSSGIIGSCAFLEQIREKYPDVIHLFCRVKPGDVVTGPEKGQPTWLVEFWIEQGTTDPKSFDIVQRINDISDVIAKEFEKSYL